MSKLIESSLLSYTPAALRKNSMGEYIEYYVLSPVTNKLERQRIFLNRLKKQYPTVKDYRTQVMQQMIRLNAQLASGWSPFGEQQDARTLTPIGTALEKYLEDKGRDMRDATMVSYTSVCGILNEWCERENLQTLPIYMFSHRLAVRFMDELLLRDKFRNNTFNTYLKKYRACWNWLKEHTYVKENPFEQIKTRRKEEKIRDLITPEQRQIVLSYIRHKSKIPNYELVLHLIFGSLIRPSEIERIQVEDVDLVRGCIHLSGEKTKTHIERYAALTPEAIEFIKTHFDLSKCPGKWFFIGHDLEPGKDPVYHGYFKKMWITTRKRCGLPKEVQLYSFKDSGITELLHAGVDALTVMKAADHHDLGITTRYADHYDENMITTVQDSKVRLAKEDDKKADIVVEAPSPMEKTTPTKRKRTRTEVLPQPVKPSEKASSIFDERKREKVLRYIKASDTPNFEIVFELARNMQIEEIESIQIKDIDLKNARIHVPASKAKSRGERHEKMDENLMRMMLPLLVNGAPSSSYLLGKTLEPSETICHGMLGYMWRKVKMACALPDNMSISPF